MSDAAIISYFVGGVVCVIGCRILLRRLKIEPTHYWRVLLGEGTEAIIVTLLLWPITLIAIALYYVLKRSAARYDVKLKVLEAERRRKERENPRSGLSLDELLKKVEEQKRTN